MSLVYKCDRCGVIEEDRKTKMDSWLEIDILSKKFYLCGKCVKEFDKFMKGENE